MGCTSSNDAPRQVWACQYCRQQFPTYNMADQHERNNCMSRPNAGLIAAQQGQAPQTALRCGSCQMVFGVPPGHAQVKCPQCQMINAVPGVTAGHAGHAGHPQPSIPVKLPEQHLGMHNAGICGQPGPDPSGRKRALLIGINYFGTRAELRGCINDVHRMSQVISMMYGFPSHEIRTLTDDQRQRELLPTRQNIIMGMHWLVQDARPGDCFFLHFSGHGAQQEDPTYMEEDGYDETICPMDFESAGMIIDSELFDILCVPLPAGAKLTVVMDCCHSGTGLDLPFVYQRGRWQEEENPCHSAGDVVLISGCEDDQCSSDGGSSYGRPMGAMTTSLCNVLEASPIISYSELIEALRRELRRGGFEQIPSLTSSQAFDVNAKHFNPICEIEGNRNPQLGRLMRKKKHAKRKNLMGGGLGGMLMAGAAGFMLGAVAGDALAMAGTGLMMGAAGGVGAVGDLAGGAGDLVGGAFDDVGDAFGGFFG